MGEYPLFFMNDELITNKIREAVQSLLIETQTELVELIFRFEGGRRVLRFIVDRPYGINVSECAELNRRISYILDEANIIEQSYVLEVSSPGIDRPLRTKRDFEKKLNKKVRIHLKAPVGDRIAHAGIVEKVEEDRVYIKTKEGLFLEIQFDNIVKAQEEIEF